LESNFYISKTNRRNSGNKHNPDRQIIINQYHWKIKQEDNNVIDQTI